MAEEIEETEENSIKNKVVDCFAYLLVLYALFFVFGMKPYAVLKAKNPDNLIQGCLYLHGYSGKAVNIDGFTTTFHSVAIKEFPIGKKLRLIDEKYPEYDTTRCHRVTYVKVFAVYRNFHFPYDLIDY